MTVLIADTSGLYAYYDGSDAEHQECRKAVADAALGLTDTVDVVMASEYHTDSILALDRRRFRMVRPLAGHTAFRLWPDDL